MGKYSIKKVNKVLKNSNFYTDRKKYVLVKLDISEYQNTLNLIKKIKDPYLEIILDKDELSLVVDQSVWREKLANKLNNLDIIKPLGLITCEVQEETVTGMLLVILSILSPNNISVYVQGAFTTDHIFVDYQDLNKAISLLNQLKQ